ncbi:MAG: transposase [Geminicoccaceae bacterium]
MAAQQKDGREPRPSIVIMDSQSVKTTKEEVRGSYGHKQVNGRKLQILADALGSLLAWRVEPANM